MRWLTRAMIMAGAAGGALAAARAAAHRRAIDFLSIAAHGTGERRWHAVTVDLPKDDVVPGGRLPAPLAALGDAIEVRTRPAPGDRGTEIYARSRDEADKALRALRRALRESKLLLETGEILLPSGPPTTRRTALNAPLAYATRHGREG
jgi:hypothetical protein